MGTEQIRRFHSFGQLILHLTSTIAVDVRNVQELPFGDRHRVPQTLDVGTVRRVANVPGHPCLHVVAIVDEMPADVEIHGEVAAKELDADTTLFQRLFDEAMSSRGPAMSSVEQTPARAIMR